MIGDRIRQARLASGSTLDHVVAKMAGLGAEMTKQALSNYENDKRTPAPSVIMQLARALGVKPSYFVSEPEISINWAAYRCQSKLLKRDKDTIEAFAYSVSEKYVYLQHTLFPDTKSAFPLPIRVLTGDEAEKAADNLRERWSLGQAPIDSLTQTIEDHGGIIIEYPMDDVTFDGRSGRINEQYPLIVVNSAVPDDRIRFNLAHEIGHLIMDCQGVSSREEENLAHRFAGALLVPADVVRKELGTNRRGVSFQELMVLKQKYGLSMQAWLYRALNLGIINSSCFKLMRIEFNKQGWNKVEPVQYKNTEQPMRLKQMTLRALAEGIITPEKAEELCPHCTEGHENMTDTEHHLFEGSPSDLLRLPRSMRRAILAKAAELAEKEYQENRDLSDFEAFGKDDFQE